MKKLPFIIGIPAVALALVLGGAMLWKVKTEVSAPSGSTMPDGFTQDQKAPVNPFSALFGKKEEPTPTPASSYDLNRDLESTVDDGGTADFNALKSDASSL